MEMGVGVGGLPASVAAPPKRERNEGASPSKRNKGRENFFSAG